MKNTTSVQWHYRFEDWHSYKVYIELKFLSHRRVFCAITGTSQIMLFVEIIIAWCHNLWHTHTHTHATKSTEEIPQKKFLVEASWNVMAHAQKPDFVFRWNGRVHLNRRERQLSRLLAAEECASAVVMLDTPCSELVWRALVTHFIRQFSIHFPSRASPCAITFKLESTACGTVSLTWDMWSLLDIDSL